VHDDWLDYGPKVDGWLQRFGGRRAIAAGLAERVTGLPARVDLAGAGSYVFVSESTRRHALEAGVRVAGGVAHSGIDPEMFRGAAEQPWAWRLLYVGRLDERKGVEDAVAALAHLPGEARLTIVGGWDEGMERRLRDLGAGLGLAERVILAGQRGRDALPAAYAAADAVVFPVRWEEPWGLVPLEAMAMGRPVVATGRGGSGEYLRDGENCLLFPSGDARALARALRRLAGDAPLRARLREDGARTAARHTERQFNAQVQRWLEQAGARARTPRPAAGAP
jgi:glycosyltransferase involved in cell wall biosynthesis